MDNDNIMNNGPQTGAETVYGTEDNNMVMSEKNDEVVSIVQQLAGSIYQEFERMINRYDEDVVKNLMPLLVNVLECLDASYRINQEQDVEVELLREDNEQLVTQYEREKSARKQAEQKLLETEDMAEQENKELASRLESLESIVRMLELKHKNSLDHANRLEERECELKKEYNKLHERYTDLFKNHVEYMERTKMLMGSTHSQMSSASERLEVNRARLNPIARSSGPVSYGFASLENSTMLDTETICSVGSGSDDSGPPSLQNELDNLQTMEPAADGDTLQQQNQSNVPANAVGRSTTKREQRSANTLYQELSFQDIEECDENEVVTGSWVHPGEYASSANDNYFGMGREVENLIMENNELLATKNALNIVKDDLIVKVDELTGEIEILREELNAMSQSRNKLRQKVSELEEELKKTKEQVKQQADTDQDENDIPMAQRKRFTRVEMAMVLMDRNQYKERLMELQEAVRFADLLRATRTVDLDKNPKPSVWKYFSGLFTHSNRSQDRVADGHGGGPMFRYSSPAHSHGSPSRGSDNRFALIAGGSHLSQHPSAHRASAGLANALISAKDYSDEGTSERANARRREQYRQLRVNVPKEDGRLQAYGWSLPIIINPELQSRHSSGVPVPVYCNSFAEASPYMKVFCGAGVNLNGGFTKDGHSVIPSSSLYTPHSTAKIAEITSPTAEHTAEAIDRHISRANLENLDPAMQLTSYVWIGASTRAASTVTVLDANQPANVLDSFPICQSHLLCIASVPGAMEKDYALLENSEVIKAGEMLERPGVGRESLGKVEFIRVRPKCSESNRNHSEESKDTTNTNTDEQAQEVIVVAANTMADEKAKEATEKSNENNVTPSTPTAIDDKILKDANDIRIRQPLPGAPQRLTTTLAIKPASNYIDDSETSEGSPLATITHPVNPILETQDRQEPPMTSIGPTMWLGAQDGMLYVHSSVGRWHECLHKVMLPDAVLSIVHIESCVVVALANAQLAVFRRQTDGQWDLNSYHLVTLGDRNHSVRCLCVAGERIWAAHRNKIFIVDPVSLNIIYSLEAHPRKESQVRQMAVTSSGVWVSIRLDSTMRLYHTHTFEHRQDVDIEPYVAKMLGTGKLGFSFVRITSLMVSCNRLWIGTSNGVIISVPLSDGLPKPPNISYQMANCCMSTAQLSFHGHRDAVKFFVSVPMSPQAGYQLPFINKRPDMLVMSGGEGYIDFRQGHSDMENSIRLGQNQTFEDRGEKSFLLVWHVSQQ